MDPVTCVSSGSWSVDRPRIFPRQIMINYMLVGGIPPSEKYEFVFPIYGKIKMFEITNQMINYMANISQLGLLFPIYGKS